MATVLDIQNVQKQDFKSDKFLNSKFALPFLKACLDDEQWFRCGEFWTRTTPKMKFFLEMQSCRIPNDSSQFLVKARLRLADVDTRDPVHFLLSVKFVWSVDVDTDDDDEYGFRTESSETVDKRAIWQQQWGNNELETWEMKLFKCDQLGKIDGAYYRRNGAYYSQDLHLVAVHAELSLYVGIRPASEQPRLLHLPDSSESSLSSDMEKLLSPGRALEADVVAQCPDGQEIPAHRFILAARSPVFAAMFQEEMRETSEGKIEIKDFSATITKELIHYLYTGRLMDEKNSLEMHSLQLLAIAEKYDVAGLKRKVELFLARSLNVERALELLCVGDTYRAETLIAAATGFIKDNLSTFATGGHISRLAKERPHLHDLIFQ